MTENPSENGAEEVVSATAGVHVGPAEPDPEARPVEDAPAPADNDDDATAPETDDGPEDDDD